MPYLRFAAFVAVFAMLCGAWAFGAQKDSPAGVTAAPPMIAAPAPAAPAAPADAAAGQEKVVKLPEGVVAMVNGEPIMEKEWIETLKRLSGRDVLNVMINRRLVQQAAAKAGATLSDEEAQAEYDKAVAAAGGPEALLNRLDYMGQTMDDFKSALRSQALLRKIVDKDVKVSDDEGQRLYLEKYGRKADVQVCVCRTQPDADSVVAQAKSGVDFATLVDQNSTDSETARNHGFLPGILTDGFFPKPYGDAVTITQPVAEQIFNLKPGDVLGPVPAGTKGFYVFKLRMLYPAKAVKFETVKDAISSEARLMKLDHAAAQYLKECHGNSDVRAGIQ